MAQDEFKFPDEAEQIKADAVPETAQAEEEFKVELVDDTPPEDRGRTPLPKNIVEELDKDDLEEYSDKVKKRLSQMKKVWHDERRAKEAAAREKEEALRFAQQQLEENKRLKQRLGVGEKAYITEATKSANNDLVNAKEKLKQAYESGDSDRITEAQEALTDAKFRIKEVERFRPSLQNEEEGVQTKQQVPTQQVSSQPQPDPKAVSWRERNTWFGADEEMTALAFGLHEKLVKAGVDPRSDEYYRQIDTTMRKRYPEAFDDVEEEKPTQTKQEEKPARANKPATVVAPVTRATAPRQVRLTPTQVAIAKKLGLSNEQYAKELMKLEAN
jgi:hypothetical protein